MTTDLRFAQPSDRDARRLKALMNIVRLFRDVYSAMPLSYMQALLAVAARPGLGVSDYCHDLDTIEPNVSRMLLHLGSKERGKEQGESGFQLIESAPDPANLRRKRTYLTPKGNALVKSIYKELARLEA